MKKLLLFSLFMVLLNAENPVCPSMITTPYDEFDITNDRTDTSLDEGWSMELDGVHSYHVEKGIYYLETCRACEASEKYVSNTNSCELDPFAEPCKDEITCKSETGENLDGTHYISVYTAKDCDIKDYHIEYTNEPCDTEVTNKPLIVPEDPVPDTNPIDAGGFTDNFGNPIQTYDNCPYGSIISEGNAILGCADAPTTPISPIDNNDLTKEYGIAPYGAPKIENLDMYDNCPSGYRKDVARNNCVLVNERPNPAPVPPYNPIPINPDSPTPDNPYNPTPINPNNPPRATNPSDLLNPYTIVNNYYDYRDYSTTTTNNDNTTNNNTTNNDTTTINNTTNNETKTNNNTTNNNNDNKIINYNIVNNNGTGNDGEINPDWGSTKDDPSDIALCNYPKEMIGVPFVLVELKGLCTSANHKVILIHDFPCEDGINVACYFQKKEQPDVNPVQDNPNPIIPPPDNNEPKPITPTPDNNKSNPILDNNETVNDDYEEQEKKIKEKLDKYSSEADNLINSITSDFKTIKGLVDGFKTDTLFPTTSSGCELKIDLYGKQIDMSGIFYVIKIISPIIRLFVAVLSAILLIRTTVLVFGFLSQMIMFSF